MPAAAQPGDGTVVTYQGIPCMPRYSFSLTSGTRPSNGHVKMLPQDIRELLVRPGVVGVDAKERPNRGGGRLLSAGALTVAERVDGLQRASVTFERVFVDYDALEEEFFTDDGSSPVLVRLVSQEVLWPTHGEMSLRANLLKEGVFSGRQRTVTEDAPIPADAFAEGSLDDNGRPWTLRKVLEERVCPALPGSPGFFVDTTGKKDSIYNQLVHSLDYPPGTLPLVVFERLLEDFDIAYGPRPDGQIDIWDRFTGGVMLPSGAPPKEDVVSFKTKGYAYNHTPLVVGVSGSQSIRERRVPILEPVGEVAGKILPLGEALDALGVPLLSSNAPIPPDLNDPASAAPGAVNIAPWLALQDARVGQMMRGIDPEAANAINTWYCRWYRLRGGPDKWASHLPMLGRVNLKNNGLTDRITVEAVSVEPVTLAALGVARSIVAGGLAANEWSPEFSRFLAAYRAADDALPPPVLRDDSDPQVPFGKTLARQVTSIGRLSPQDKQRRLQFAARLIAANISSAELMGLVNGPVQTTESFSVDAEQGLIKFDSPVGYLRNNGAQAVSNAIFPGYTAVTFSYVARPDDGEPYNEHHRYLSWWALDGGRVLRLEEKPKGSYPRVIHMPELRQVTDVVGTTNKALLDSLAKQAASPVLTRSKGDKILNVRMHRPIPLVCTGRVLSVEWGGEPSIVNAQTIGPGLTTRHRLRSSTAAIDDDEGDVSLAPRRRGF